MLAPTDSNALLRKTIVYPRTNDTGRRREVTNSTSPVRIVRAYYAQKTDGIPIGFFDHENFFFQGRMHKKQRSVPSTAMASQIHKVMLQPSFSDSSATP